MSKSCAALALALLTATTSLAAEEVAVVPAAVAHQGCGGCCGASCLQRLWGWMTYRALPVGPCCRVWITPRYCYPPTNTFFIRDCPHCGPGGCGAVQHPVAAPCATCAAAHASAAPSQNCQNGSCSKPAMGGWLGELLGR